MKRFLLALFPLLMAACSPTSPELIVLTGEAQGTTYNIRYYDEQQRQLKPAIDSILLDFDNSLSTWNKQSVITKVNQLDSGLTTIEDPFGYLLTVWQQSQAVYAATDGAFDPTVMPLVRGWGFAWDEQDGLDSTQVDSLVQLVGFDTSAVHLYMDNGLLQLYKRSAHLELDFNAIAQGYSVDVVSNYLSLLGIDNHLVELGGEIRVRGQKPDQTLWTMGVDKPVENPEQRELKAIISARDRGSATSGNYRKFYVKDGIKYAHTIDPKTGFPVQHSLLSATVLADDCASADAYATAFMVMGLERSKAFLEQHPELLLEAYFIYADEQGAWQTWATPSIESNLKELN